MTPLWNKLDKWKILRGEKYSSDHAGEKYSVGIKIPCRVVDNNLLGIPLLLEVLIDFAGVRRLCRGRSFRGFWLRITQLYPVKEITLLNQAGRRVRVLRGDELPEFTGDKLTVCGYEFQFSWGARLDFSGEALICWGSDSFEC